MNSQTPSLEEKTKVEPKKHKRPVKKQKRKAASPPEAESKKKRPKAKKKTKKKKDSVAVVDEEQTPMLIAENKVNVSIAETNPKQQQSDTKKKPKKRKRKQQQNGEFIVVWTLPNEFIPKVKESYKNFAPEKREKLKKQFLEETKHLRVAGENIRLNGSKRDVARGTALKTHGGLLQTQLLVETRVVKRKNGDQKTITRTVIVSKEKSLNAKTSINSVYLKLWRKLIRKYMAERKIPFFIPSKKSTNPEKKKLYDLIIIDYAKQKAIVSEYLKKTEAKTQSIEKAIKFYNSHADAIVKMETTTKKKKSKAERKPKKKSKVAKEKVTKKSVSDAIPVN